jgi:hypothetical protein
MRNDIRNACALLAALALSGCFAEVEDKSLVFQQSLPACDGGGTNCAFTGVGPAGQLIAIIVGPQGATFTVDLGDQEFLEAKKDLRLMTLENTLTLNSLALHITTAGADFSGIQLLKLRQIASDLPVPAADALCASDACALPSCQDIATYDQARDGVATDTIALRGGSLNLLDLMSGGSLRLCVVASGAPPAQDWRADATLDLRQGAPSCDVRSRLRRKCRGHRRRHTEGAKAALAFRPSSFFSQASTRWREARVGARRLV